MGDLSGNYVWGFDVVSKWGFRIGNLEGVSVWGLSYRILRGESVCCIQLGISNGDFE